jgi:hypothetical protein
MRIGEPLRALIIEAGERALLELLRRPRVLRQNAVGVAGVGLDANEVRRVQPGLAQIVEFFGGIGDADRARIGGVGAGGDIRRQALGKGEGLERGGRGVARAIFERGPEPERPARMEDAEGRIVVAGDGDDGLKSRIPENPVTL